MPIIESIAAYFLAKVVIKLANNASGTVSRRLQVRSSRAGSEMLCNYHSMYPLLSSKYHDFIAWRRCLAISMSGSDKLSNGIDLRRRIKNERHGNKSDWTHMSSMYTRKNNTTDLFYGITHLILI